MVLANLSGFDGSPDSMRNLQLEYGAEIGRAIVNFDGPIVFCVISRYHGGAFVVFSKALNPNMTVLARRGLVRLGASAAPPRRRWCSPARSTSAPRRAPPYASSRRGSPRPRASERSRLLVEQAELRAAMRAEKISEVAAEFDGVHNIHRAVEVGSVDAVIPAVAAAPGDHRGHRALARATRRRPTTQ